MNKNNYFKIIYMMSGKYKAKYEAVILSWEKGNIRIRDIDLKEHNIKEDYIVSIKPIIPQKKSIKSYDNEKNTGNEQQKINF